MARRDLALRSQPQLGQNELERHLVQNGSDTIDPCGRDRADALNEVAMRREFLAGLEKNFFNVSKPGGYSVETARRAVSTVSRY